MLVSFPPAAPLARYVTGYWFVQDLAGAHQGQPIRTAPHPGAVLTVNIGRPNAMIGGPLVPPVSLLGVQTAARGWRSWSDTYFVMVMLTLRGVTRLFPSEGPAMADRLADGASLLGDGPARALAADIAGAWQPERIRPRLDAWLIARLDAVRPAPEIGAMAEAQEELAASGSVARAAARAGVTRRQLARWCDRHFGVAPKTLADLERLGRSLRAAQHAGDSMDGYSDQSHQIRAWKRRLDLTPGAYLRSGASDLARAFGGPADAPGFYL